MGSENSSRGLPTESSEVARRLFSEDVAEDGHDELVGLVDEGSEIGSERCDGEEFDEELGGMYTDVQLNSMLSCLLPSPSCP